jgi:hypothetical protein
MVTGNQVFSLLDISVVTNAKRLTADAVSLVICSWLRDKDSNLD